MLPPRRLRSNLFPYTTLFRSCPFGTLHHFFGWIFPSRYGKGNKRVESNKTYARSEEHTSELQSPDHLVCRLLLEKKNLQGRVHRVLIVSAGHRGAPAVEDAHG